MKEKVQAALKTHVRSVVSMQVASDSKSTPMDHRLAVVVYRAHNREAATALYKAMMRDEWRDRKPQAQPGVTYRAEPEFDQSRNALDELSRALASRELGSAYDTVQRATPAVERLSRFLEEDVALSEQNQAFTKRPPDVVRDAQRHASQAVPKVREIRDELAKLFPDPKSTLSPGEQQKMDQLAKRQAELEQKAGELQRKLGDLMQKAPVFPPNAQGQLGESGARNMQNFDLLKELGRVRRPVLLKRGLSATIEEWLAASDAHALDRVFLVAPSSPTERLALAARASRGFVYAASTMGVTGTRAAVGEHAERLVADARRAGAPRVCVGLGVSTAAQAAEVAAYADGVIVGSAFVRPLLDAPNPAAGLAALADAVQDLARGVRGES